MEEKYVNKINQSKSALYVDYNAGMSVIKKKMKLETLDTLINPEGISNILYIPILEKYGTASHMILKKSG